MAQKKQKTLEEWNSSRIHEDVMLPSGFQVDITVPNLPQMIASGAIPNNLVDVAIGVAQGAGRTPGREVIEQSVEFAAKVVSTAVVNPVVTEQDVLDNKLPYEDVEMIVEIATRQRDLDAIGRHIGGLDKLQEFRSFRRLDGE
jgi:hypothetical protein